MINPEEMTRLLGQLDARRTADRERKARAAARQRESLKAWEAEGHYNRRLGKSDNRCTLKSCDAADWAPTDCLIDVCNCHRCIEARGFRRWFTAQGFPIGNDI